MSHPQPQLRALLDDGPHSGQTISITPDPDGHPPARIEVHGPSEGRQVRQRSPGRDQIERSAADDGVLAYELGGADEDLGLWVYRVAAG